MPDLSGLGDLVISVGGDISPLEEALAAVPQAAAGVSSQIDDLFAGMETTAGSAEAAISGVASSLENLAAAAESAATPVGALGEQMGLFSDETETLAFSALPAAGEQMALFTEYTGEASSALGNIASATQQANAGYMSMTAQTEEAAGSHIRLITQLYLARYAFDAIRSSIEGLITPYADLQKAQLALGAMLGDQSKADAAINSAKQLADALGLAQDAAISEQQKLIALGQSLSDVPRDLTAIADGAAAMNTSFDTAAQRFDQIINSGSLMARSLTSIGISTNDVAAAMGLAGVPATTLTAIFKQLDESQRAAVISSAELSKNAGDAAAAAAGAAGQWNAVKNAFENAKQAMGEASGGFTVLIGAVTGAIKVFEDLYIAATGDVKEMANVITNIFSTLSAVFVGFGKVVADSFSGNIAAIPSDLAEMEQKVQAAQQTFKTNYVKDWQDTGNAISGIWATTNKAIATSSQDGATGAANAMTMLQQALAKSETNFRAVATAFSQGKVTASEYTAALTALNKQQEDVNNGFQDAHTALLIVQNDYRLAGVAFANALTDFKATTEAVNSGTATWGQYVKALDAYNKAQEEVNGGLQDAHTAYLLVDADLENLAIAAQNANTYFDQVAKQYAVGNANLYEYTNALNAANKAQMEFNNGLENAHTALLIAQNTYEQLQVTLANATTTLQAVYEAYAKNTAGLNQLIDATNAYVKATEDANGGLLTVAAAMAAVAAEQSKLNVENQNAQTLLNAARGMLDQGTISLGTYQEYLKKAQTAQDALNGSTKTATDATQSLTIAHQALTSGLAGTATAFQQTSGDVSDFASNLMKLNGQWVTYGGVGDAALATTSNFASGLAIVDGKLVELTTNSTAATGAVTNLATGMSMLNGQLVNFSGSTASAAASGMKQIAQAAANATSMVQQLDQAMNDVAGVSLGQSLDQTMNAKLGSLSLSLQAGQQYSDRLYQIAPLGSAAGSSLFGANPFAGMNIPGTEQMTYDAATYAKQIQQQIDSQNKAAAATTTAAAATTSASTSLDKLAQAMQDAQAANQLEAEAMLAQGTSAYASLKASADAAVQAAGDEIKAAMGLSTSASTLATSSTALVSTTSSLATTAANLGVVAQAATVASVGAAVAAVSAAKAVAPAGAIGSLGLPSFGTASSNMPSVGTFGGVGNGQPVPLYSSSAQGSIVNFDVNLQNANIVGQNAAQNLADTMANAMISKFAQMGIRLTRQ